MKKRYVYYKEDRGQITDILAEKKDEKQAYIVCDVDEVIDFLSGKRGTNEFIIAYNKTEDKHVMMKKDNVIRLRKLSKEPFKIPYKEENISDLNLIYYIDNTLEVSLDVSRIAPLYQTDWKKEVRFEKGTEIRILIKKKNDDKFVKEYIIDAQELLQSGQMFFDLEKDITPDNIELFTYNLFETYSWYKASLKVTSPLREKIKFEIHKADTKVKSDSFTYHLIIQNDSKSIKITNNIESLKLIRFDSFIDFFIVDKHDPNILYDKFTLTKEHLNKKEIVLHLDIDLKGKTILYNHKYISVLIKE
jgi:hypothetical protein